MSPPVFAILGHPNEGKSSVVSTLVEDETIAVSRTPGETRCSQTHAVVSEGKPVLSFIDTPGFQNPAAVLEWFEAHPGPEDRLVADFLEAHAGNERFHHDVELLRPLAKRAGILYVADASRPLRDFDRKEMEILRLTGLPRMALLNLKRGDTTWFEEWRDAVGRRFNILREFNAHHATFSERLRLLEALKVLNQDWEPALDQVIGGLRADWDARLRESVLVLETLLADALAHTHRHALKPGDDPKASAEAAKEGWRHDIRDLEARARKAWRRVFRHKRLPGGETDAVYTDDLFASRVWRLLGLSRRQVATFGAVTGGLLGAGADLAAGGLTFGVFAASGAALGAVGALRGGRKLGAKARLLPGGRTLASEGIEVGPVHDPRLVSVLLDRSLLYLARLMNWSHGRRDHASFLAGLSEHEGFVSSWKEEHRSLLLRWYTLQVKGRENPELSTRFRERMVEVLSRLCE